MVLKESSTWNKSDLLKISFMASMACGSSSISMQCILRDMVCLLGNMFENPVFRAWFPVSAPVGFSRRRV